MADQPLGEELMEVPDEFGRLALRIVVLAPGGVLGDQGGVGLAIAFRGGATGGLHDLLFIAEVIHGVVREGIEQCGVTREAGHWLSWARSISLMTSIRP
jgi:hypothetical protein